MSQIKTENGWRLIAPASRTAETRQTRFSLFNKNGYIMSIAADGAVKMTKDARQAESFLESDVAARLAEHPGFYAIKNENAWA